MIPIAQQIRTLNQAASVSATTALGAPRPDPCPVLTVFIRIWLDELRRRSECCAADIRAIAPAGGHEMVTRAARVAARCGWLELVSVGRHRVRHYRITPAGRAAARRKTLHIPQGVSIV